MRTPRIELTLTDARRITAAHELLARACIEIGIKAKGSAKLTRALEDVAQARDTLWEISKTLPRDRIASDAVYEALHIEYLDQLVFSAMNGAIGNWKPWREREDRKRQGEEDGE